MSWDGVLRACCPSECDVLIVDLSGLLLNDSSDVTDDFRLSFKDKSPVILDFEKKKIIK